MAMVTGASGMSHSGLRRQAAMRLVWVARLPHECYLLGPGRPYRYCFWSRPPFERPPLGSSLALVMPRGMP